jgi:predicted deacylase
MAEAASAAFPWSIVPEPGAGEKRSGYLRWRDPIFGGLEWPYYAVRGNQPGRAVAITAAIHGGEYPGILGALRLARMLQADRVRGSLLILPIVNLPSFWARTAFATPQDGRNLNRSFPGNALGTFSEVLARRVMDDVIGPADTLIDLHSGDVFETLAHHTARYETGDEATDALSWAMCEAFGVQYALTYPRPKTSGTTTGNSTLAGKATMLVEVGGNALASEEDVQVVFQGLINALRVLGVLQGLPTSNGTHWLTTGQQLTAPTTGLWRSAVQLHQQVQPGDLLGTLTDPLGNDLAQLTADVEGIVLYYLSSLAAKVGDPLVNVSVEYRV